jgi:hypothetical protein
MATNSSHRHGLVPPGPVVLFVLVLNPNKQDRGNDRNEARQARKDHWKAAPSVRFDDLGDETGKALDWDDAARAVNISARSMRKSLERPAVRQYLLAQRVVLRSCLSAKNLLRLDAPADQKTNLNAAVKGSQIIEAVSDEALTARPMASFDPHVTIRIIAESPEPPNATIDIIPAPFASQRLPEPEPSAREPTLWDCSAAAGDRRPEPPYPVRQSWGYVAEAEHLRAYPGLGPPAGSAWEATQAGNGPIGGLDRNRARIRPCALLDGAVLGGCRQADSPAASAVSRRPVLRGTLAVASMRIGGKLYAPGR